MFLLSFLYDEYYIIMIIIILFRTKLIERDFFYAILTTIEWKYYIIIPYLFYNYYDIRIVNSIVQYPSGRRIICNHINMCVFKNG